MVTIIISQEIRLLTIPEIIYVHCRRGHIQVNIVYSERSTKWLFYTTVNILSVDISQVIRYVVIDTFLICIEFKKISFFKKQNLL